LKKEEKKKAPTSKIPVRNIYTPRVKNFTIPGQAKSTQVPPPAAPLPILRPPMRIP